MKELDENALVYALTQRDVDARDLSHIFKPEWLKNKELIPVVKAIYNFLHEKGVTPSFAALREYMADSDESMYEQRHKLTITALEMHPADDSKQLLAVEKARSKAAALALSSTLNTETFRTAMVESNGKVLLAEMSRWINEYQGTQEEKIMNIKDAMDTMVKETPVYGRERKIPTGIHPIDNWSSGGLRPGEFGIVIAPTGGGKSCTLLNIAYNTAMYDERNVLLLTNELTRTQQAERFLARMQGIDEDNPGKFTPIQVIQNDPIEAYRGLEHKWRHGLEKRLYIGHFKLNGTAEDIDSIMHRLKLQYGFSPEVLIIDYMERMAPVRKVNLEKEWIYLQEIAKELVDLAARRHCMIWTAVQTNRSGMNPKNSPGLDTVQGSVRHLQAADCIVSCRKAYVPLSADDEEGVECMEFQEWKQRSSENRNRKMFIRTNLQYMFITDEEVIPPSEDDIEVADARKDEQEEKKQKAAARRGGSGVKSPWESIG